MGKTNKHNHLEWRVFGEGVEVGGLGADDLAVRERLEPGPTPRRAHPALPLAGQASFVVGAFDGRLIDERFRSAAVKDENTRAGRVIGAHLVTAN